MTLEELKNFRQFGSRTAGHPEYGHAAGIETTTGPLGQGLANAVGMAHAERLLNARFGDDLVDHHTYCIVGAGCLRSEEPTYELQSLMRISYAVFCLTKKKKSHAKTTNS